MRIPIYSEADRETVISRIRKQRIMQAPEKTLIVDLGRGIPPASAGQRGLLWVWHQLVADATGHTAKEIHAIVKEVLLPPSVKVIAGEEKTFPASVADLDQRQMKEFMDRYRVWADQELGINLPDAQCGGERALPRRGWGAPRALAS